jgi:hypothetical protein
MLSSFLHKCRWRWLALGYRDSVEILYRTNIGERNSLNCIYGIYFAFQPVLFTKLSRGYSMKGNSKFLAAVAFAFSAAGSQASVIDFGDLASGSCNYLGAGTVQSRGFDFNGNSLDSGMFLCDAGVIQHNTSGALINANSLSIITMAQTGGGVFSLNSFFAGGRTDDFNPDGAVSSYSVATGIDIVGNLLGGGTVSTSIVLDSSAPYAWLEYLLPASFANLTSVVFTAQGGDTAEFLIDDIAVNEHRNSVPEPGILSLLAGALVGLGFLRKRSPIN